MITRQQIEQVQAFPNSTYLVTSCYLNLDRRDQTPQAHKIRIKDLLQAAQQQLDKKAGTHSQRESVRGDFAAIEAFILPNLATNLSKAVAIFSCVGEKYWQTFSLPRLARNILIADRTPYLHPLTALLAEYPRYCIVLVDRVHGRIFEFYLGEIGEHGAVADDLPRRVREAGWGGRDERNRERHVDQAVAHHCQHLADATIKLFQKDQCDRLILAGQRESVAEYQKHLPADLQQRIVGGFHADPAKITVPEVLEQSRAIAQRVERDHEIQLAATLVQQANAGPGAVTGLSAVLAALDQGAAQTLLVEDGFAKAGHACFTCHYPSLLPADCPHCQQPTAPCADLVDEVRELARHRNCQVKHLSGATALRDSGRIGAVLRFPAA